MDGRRFGFGISSLTVTKYIFLLTMKSDVIIIIYCSLISYDQEYSFYPR